jgi:ankyrin repeat protein
VGANVDVADSEGITPLMWASKRDHADVCILLIKSGANLRRRS